MIKTQTTIDVLLDAINERLACYRFLSADHPLNTARDDLLLCGTDRVLRFRAAADAARALAREAA